MPNFRADHTSRQHFHTGSGFHAPPGSVKSPDFNHRPGHKHPPGFHRPGFDHGSKFGHRPHPGHLNRFHWHGGFWHGHFWPRVHYHANFVYFWPSLPAVHSIFWHNGTPYYYVDRVYYTWSPERNGYVATDPPPAAENGSAETEAPAGEEVSGDTMYATEDEYANVYIYPREGQSEEQTANDRYECHKWAVEQTGFDPTAPVASSSSGTGTGSASGTTHKSSTAPDYRRALIACLDAKGYSAR